jgi:hypothetical protein
VAQMDVEDALPGIGPLPLNIETGHHNAVAGRDEWGPGPDRDGVEALIVVGRTAPSPAAVKCMAEALTGSAIDPLPSWYEKADAAYEMADGTFRPAETDRHPNAVAEAVRWHILEGELIQIIGRARGVNRTRDNPVDILVMTNAPLPIPVGRARGVNRTRDNPVDIRPCVAVSTFGAASRPARRVPGSSLRRHCAEYDPRPWIDRTGGGRHEAAMSGDEFAATLTAPVWRRLGRRACVIRRKPFRTDG